MANPGPLVYNPPTPPELRARAPNQTMRPALPLSVQLLLTFVGLLAGITAVLTRAANISLRENLESDARRVVSVATRTREQSITQLFQLRQQRAEAILVSIRSMCTEPLGGGRRLDAVGDGGS